MADVLIVGDGPAGLSAALFLAKRQLAVEVFGVDQTPMHRAMLYNYLGVPAVEGSEFMRVAREQVRQFGAELHDVEVVSAEQGPGGFTVATAGGERHQGRYLLLATGTKRHLAESLGLTLDEDGGVVADRNGVTAVEGLYCVGWSVRPMKIQAIISAGDGAAAAVDILSREAGKDLHDFDVLPSS